MEFFSGNIVFLPEMEVPFTFAMTGGAYGFPLEALELVFSFLGFPNKCNYVGF